MCFKNTANFRKFVSRKFGYLCDWVEAGGAFVIDGEGRAPLVGYKGGGSSVSGGEVSSDFVIGGEVSGTSVIDGEVSGTSVIDGEGRAPPWMTVDDSEGASEWWS